MLRSVGNLGYHHGDAGDGLPGTDRKGNGMKSTDAVTIRYNKKPTTNELIDALTDTWGDAIISAIANGMSEDDAHFAINNFFGATAILRRNA